MVAHSLGVENAPFFAQIAWLYDLSLLICLSHLLIYASLNGRNHLSKEIILILNPSYLIVRHTLYYESINGRATER